MQSVSVVSDTMTSTASDAVQTAGRVAVDVMQPEEKPTGKNLLPAFRVTKIKSLKGAAQTLLLLTVYLTVCGAVMDALEEDWNGVDAVYFSMATMSTVGYGDISPSSAGARVFVVFMILIGIVFVFSSCAGLVSEVTAPLTRRGREYL